MATVDKRKPRHRVVDLVSSSKEGVGAARVCHCYDLTNIKETGLTMEEKHMNMVMSEYSFLMKKFDANLNAVPRGDGIELFSRVNYSLKYGPLGIMMGKIMMKYLMKQKLQNAFPGIDY